LAAFLGAGLLASAFAAASAAEPTFPYKAVITSDDTPVRSGPGENYYPTDRLKAGEQVEVYRHDPGGWYAIRPPQGSFSWVDARSLQAAKDNLATAVEDRVPVAVGSRFSNIRDVIQVRLSRGEAVEVLGVKSDGLAGTTSGNQWYKIAPPAGEFRWVDGKHVEADHAPDASQRPKTAGPPLSAEQFQKAIDDLDVELSTMVVEEPTVWDFAELHSRAESVFDQAQTASQRGQARLLLGKIARFEDIRDRYKKLGAMQIETARADRQSARLSRTTLPRDPEGRFDAVGRLARVASPKPGTPQYAILDPGGNVRCYVSPLPGVNLQYYVGRDIGINGTRGYMPEQKAAHVMARQVTPVDGTLLR
jgi:uncharacterized protein YgiM (DUF1202 family)